MLWYKSVISGSRARTAHSMIHEVLTSMMLEAFLSNFPERRTELEALQVNCQSKELVGEEWSTAITPSKQPFKSTLRKGHRCPNLLITGILMFQTCSQ